MVNISFIRETLLILVCAIILSFYELLCLRILGKVFESNCVCCKSTYCVSWLHILMKFFGFLESYPLISPEFELYCNCYFFFYSPFCTSPGGLLLSLLPLPFATIFIVAQFFITFVIGIYMCICKICFIVNLFLYLRF